MMNAEKRNDSVQPVARSRKRPVLASLPVALAVLLLAGGPSLAMAQTGGGGSESSAEVRNAPLTLLQAVEQARADGTTGMLVEAETKTRRNSTEFELEFFDGRYETELRIDATDGRVLKSKREARDVSTSRADRAARRYSLYQTATLSLEDAIQSAIDEGLEVEEAKLDEDDGRLIIELELRRDDRAEIEREIDAVTGELLSEKVDR